MRFKSVFLCSAPTARPHRRPKMALSSTGPVVLSAAQINRVACAMRPRPSEWVQVRVCLEELSIVFGPRTSVLGFFSGLQETWPPCAEEPFGTGRGRGNGGGGGHGVKMWVILKLENNPKVLWWSEEERGSGSLDSKKSTALIEVPPLHCLSSLSLFFFFLPVCVCFF